MPAGKVDVPALGTPAIAALEARRPTAQNNVALRTKVMLNLPKWITPEAKGRARLGCKLSGLARATSFRTRMQRCELECFEFFFICRANKVFRDASSLGSRQRAVKKRFPSN